MTPGRRPRIPLAGDPFDRSAHRRANGDWVEAAAGAPDTVFLPVQGSRNLVDVGPPVRPALLSAADADALARLASEQVLLGLRDGRAHFALALAPDAGQSPPGCDWRDLRWVGAELEPDDAAMLAYARAMSVWHARHRFCATCGAATTPVDAGHARLCTRARVSRTPWRGRSTKRPGSW